MSEALPVVVAAGAWLPFVGERWSHAMAWEQSFVGSLFIAFSTSLPEVAVTIAAVRIAALDLAIGNLFGSNLFDVAILAVDDLAYVRGPLLAGLAIIGLFYRPGPGSSG